MAIPYSFNPLGISMKEERPLTLTAVEASTVKLTATGSPNVAGLHYRLGTAGTWLTYTIGTTIPLASGDSVQFRNTLDTLSSSSTSYAQYGLSGRIAASGNIMSLLNWSAACPDYCFSSLFLNATALISPPELPSTSLGASCYYQLFRGSGITAAPVLPAKTLASSSYSRIFWGTDITSIHLPSYAFTPGCYIAACLQCTHLTEARIDADGLVANSLNTAFSGCSSLSRIEVNFTSWGTTNSTTNWVSGVAASGTFIKPTSLPEEYGPNRIPTGWTVVNK